MVKSASQGISAGCGVRVISGERTGYAYTDDLSPERILHAARTAALIATGPAKTPSVGFQEKPARSLYPISLPSVDAEISAKVELVMRADQSARAYDPRIKEVRASYTGRAAQYPGGRLGRHLRRRLAAPGPHERWLHRQDGDQFCPRQLRRRRPGGSRFLLRRKDPRVFRQRIGPPGDSAARRPRSAGRRNGSRARPGLARRSAARSRRPRPGSRFQPQADLGLCRPDRQARGQREMHRGRQRHHALAPRFAQRGRRRRAHAGNRAHRKRNSERLSQRQAFRPPDGHGRHRQRTPRKLRAHPHAAHDQHLHAGGPG